MGYDQGNSFPMDQALAWRQRPAASPLVVWLCGSGSVYGQFLGQDFVTGNADGATATGGGSTAVGKTATASGAGSTALGDSSTASGAGSTALGNSSAAS